MNLLSILALLAAVVGGVLAVLLAVCVGVRRLRGPVSAPDRYKERLLNVAPYVGGLALVLAINKGLHRYSVEASKIVGLNVTGYIVALEGSFVATLQAAIPKQAVLYFSFIYVFGYVVLLVFPLIGYFFLDSLRHLKVLIAAYAVNYAGGVLCYTLFVAYGPRNVMPDSVSQLLYEEFPQVMLLTSSVNTNSNVFPSLHTSLAVTAMVMAIATHDDYPRWTPIALFVGSSVVFSTMYLGIHWLTDVVGGVVLGVLSVYAGEYLVGRIEGHSERSIGHPRVLARWRGLRNR